MGEAKSSLKWSKKCVPASERSRATSGPLSGSQHSFDDSTANYVGEAPLTGSKFELVPVLLRHVKNCILPGAGPLRGSPSFLEGPGWGGGRRKQENGGGLAHTWESVRLTLRPGSAAVTGSLER